MLDVDLAADAAMLHMKIVPTKDTLLYLASNPPVSSVTVHADVYTGSVAKYSFDVQFVTTETDALVLRLLGKICTTSSSTTP